MQDDVIHQQDTLMDPWGEISGYGSCELCHSSFLLFTNTKDFLCPNCLKAKLSFSHLNSPDLAKLSFPVPELFLPFLVNSQSLSRTWEGFFSGYWFRPPDLSLTGLQERLTAVYYPVWLVDAEVQADWEAEVGFNYQVLSHKDRYDQSAGGWKSQEVQETRQRWVPRIGKLQRQYQNITSPALEAHTELMNRLGSFPISSIEPFDLDRAFPDLPDVPVLLRLPDRDQQESWQDTQPGFERAAAAECLQATGADHIRSFRWSPEYAKLNWTLCLFPMLVTFYRDDDGNIYPLLLNGQNGHISGLRKASLNKARKTSLVLLFSAVVMFLISLLAFAAAILTPVAFLIGFVGVILSLVIGIGAVIPVGMAWWFNRKTL